MAKDSCEDPSETVARKSQKDVIFGFGTLVAAILFAAIVIPAGVVAPTSVKALPLDPRFLPYVLVTLVGLFGLICALQGLLGPGVPKEAGEDEFKLRRHWPYGFLVVLAAGLAYCLLPEEIGMLPVSALVTGVLVWFGGERRIIVTIGVAIVLPLLVYLFFTKIAQVPLPEGLTEGWL